MVFDTSLHNHEELGHVESLMEEEIDIEYASEYIKGTLCDFYSKPS